MKIRLKLLKVCSCGKLVMNDAPYLGVQEMEGLYDFLLYNCQCGSTIAVKKLKERKVAIKA